MGLYIVIAYLLTSPVSNYCTCISPGKIDDKQYNKYDLIIKGNIVSISEENFQRIFSIEVDTWYKGTQKKDTIEIYSPQQEGACGLPARMGEQWLMYAFAYDNTFRTDLCTRSKSMSHKGRKYNKKELSADLKFLKKKRKKNADKG